MSSWKRRKPIGNFQSSYVKKYVPQTEIFQQNTLYSFDKRNQYRKAIEIDDNIFHQEYYSDINELIQGYEKFFSTCTLSNGNSFINKLRQLRYKENIHYHSGLDINLIDLFGRLIKYLSLYQDPVLESFCELFISTKDEELIETFVSFYLMNFNKKYYDYI